MAGVPLDKYAKHRAALLAEQDDWELTNRPAMIPFLAEYTNKTSGEKSGGFAWPSMVTEPVDAYKRLMGSMTDENGALALPNPQNPDNQRDMVTALLGLYGGNAVNPLTKAPFGSLRAGGQVAVNPYAQIDAAILESRRYLERHGDLDAQLLAAEAAVAPLAISQNTVKARASGGITHGGNNQTPFYGAQVGPKGQIADPAASADQLGLRSGLVGAPVNGFFNPATSALMQQGVQPKQTLAYYQKQMGSRGGKLPPGMWEKATEGLAPSQSIARDEIVRRLDELAPEIQLQKYTDEKQVYDGVSDRAKYQKWSTPGKFENYSETAVGYPKPSELGANGKNGVKPFSDAHFGNNPNLEGWYRTQDNGSSRILEEVQPQRYQSLRDNGPHLSPEAADALNKSYVALYLESSDIFEQAIKDFKIKPEKERNSWDRHGIAEASLERVVSGTIRGDQAKAAAILEKQKSLSNDMRHIKSQIHAARNGVNPSPYTDDVNAATDHLLKNALRDAADDGIDRIAWPSGEAQSMRYGKSSDSNGMTGYYGSGPHGDGGILTDRVQSIAKRLTGETPEIQPQTFQTAGGNVQYPSVHLTPEMLAAIRQKGLPLFSNAAPWLTAFGISEMLPDDEYTY